jgi:hypothetical protein
MGPNGARRVGIICLVICLATILVDLYLWKSGVSLRRTGILTAAFAGCCGLRLIRRR